MIVLIFNTSIKTESPITDSIFDIIVILAAGIFAMIGIRLGSGSKMKSEVNP
jgi:hypothetical protein